jgi:2-polyprenyl-6-methoxyphenol hydroxylase-like FAD-dependent oxidoreductase
MSTAPARPEFDVCIRGSGPVGAALALALSRQGLQVVQIAAPRAPASAVPDLRTYALNAASVRLLEDLRVWDALPPDARTPVHDMQVTGDAGGQLAFSAWQQGVEALAWIVDAAALDESLAQALKYAPHVRSLGEDAPSPSAALLALCEGKQSATRERLGVEFEVQPYGQRAVAARLVADVPHHGVARQWFRSPDVLALLPFDRPQAGHSYGLVWSLPEDRAAELLVAPVDEFEAALHEACGDAAGTLRLASDRAAWPLMLGRARSWSGAGWVLVGDAAHVVHPLAGQGLNLGLGDVAALARVLADARRDSPWKSLGDERTLRRYVRERQVPALAMSSVTDGLLHLFAQPAAPLQALRNQGLSVVERLGPLKRWMAARALGS